MSRIGDWIQTHSGRQFFPLDPRAEEMHPEDIAHALSNLCRFNGHVKHFYSVAEHSVRVSMIVPPKDQLWGLLHDASEAYLIDLPKPLKRSGEMGRLYMEAEAKVMREVCTRFELPLMMPESVEEADLRLLLTEARDLMAPPPVPWKEVNAKPLDEKIEPWTPRKAKERFLLRLYQLAPHLRPIRERQHFRLEVKTKVSPTMTCWAVLEDGYRTREEAERALKSWTEFYGERELRIEGGDDDKQGKLFYSEVVS